MYLYKTNISSTIGSCSHFHDYGRKGPEYTALQFFYISLDEARRDDLFGRNKWMQLFTCGCLPSAVHDDSDSTTFISCPRWCEKNSAKHLLKKLATLVVWTGGDEGRRELPFGASMFLMRTDWISWLIGSKSNQGPLWLESCHILYIF